MFAGGYDPHAPQSAPIRLSKSCIAEVTRRDGAARFPVVNRDPVLQQDKRHAGLKGSAGGQIKIIVAFAREA
jgi:hypothetical protein